MGGLITAIGDKLAQSPMGAEVADKVLSVGHIFERTEEGQLYHGMLKNTYYPTLHAAQESLGKQALERAKLDPAAPPVDIKAVHTQASKIARHQTNGAKDAIPVTLAASIEKKHGLLAAQSFSNAVAFVLKDYQDTAPLKDSEGKITGRKSTGAVSPFKVNVQRVVPGIDVKPTYQPKGPIERAVTSTIYRAFAPLIAIPHIATTFNGMFGSSPDKFLAGLAAPIGKSLSAGIDQMQGMVTSGAFAETSMRDIAEWNQFKATGHPAFTGSSAAYLVHKLFYQPGFSALRDYTLLSGANVGKMTAEGLARDFAKNPTSKKLAWQLGEFGLDPANIMKQGGKLSQDDLNRAVYRFVDRHYFLDNSLSRSMLLQSSWQGRILGTFHGYVTRQAKLMASAMFGNMKQQGVAATVKNLAIGGILFPAMGEGIKVIQRTYRGQDTQLDEDMENIEGKHGFNKAAATYAEMLSHVGAFGVYAHVLRGAQTHQLLNTLAGPVLSGPGDLATDTYHAVAKDFTDRPDNIFERNPRTGKHWAPVTRDLMFDTPGLNVLGQALSHRLSPTAKDKPSKDPLRELYEYMGSSSQEDDSKNKQTKENF